jgi:hypothetical protein
LYLRDKINYGTTAGRCVDEEKIRTDMASRSPCDHERTLSQGVVDKVVLRNAEGEVTLTVDDGKFVAKNFDPGDTALEAKVLSHSARKADTIRGGYGSEYPEGLLGVLRLSLIIGCLATNDPVSLGDPPLCGDRPLNPKRPPVRPH